MAKVCYYCGGKATSKEHVPPKQMFKAFLCDSITVDACDKHNTARSGRDHAIVTAFLQSLYHMQNSGRRYSIIPDVAAAIDVAHAHFERSKKLVKSRPSLADPPVHLSGIPKVAHLSHGAGIRDWIQQLTAALVFHGTGYFDSTINWSKSLAFSFDFWDFVTDKPPTMAEVNEWHEQIALIKNYYKELSWQTGWSSHPTPYPSTIYYFQLYFGPQQHIIFHHRFYTQYSWYVRVEVSKSTRDLLQHRAHKVSQNVLS